MNRRSFLKRMFAGAALAATASYAPSLLKRDESREMTLNGVPIRQVNPLDQHSYEWRMGQRVDDWKAAVREVNIKPIDATGKDTLTLMREAMEQLTTHGSTAVFYANPKTLKRVEARARWQTA